MISKLQEPVFLRIVKRVQESKNSFSLFFDFQLDAQPGQFLMCWVPGIDEKPMAVAYQSKKQFGVTVQVYGPFSEYLSKLKVGDKVGFRGPFGKPFPVKKENACVVAGGVGISSLATLIEQLKNPAVIAGARSQEHIIYQERFKNAVFCTDDGSFGFKGYNTVKLDETLAENRKIKTVYTCGPEAMIVNVLKVCEKHNVECYASVERFMKCAFGICGACCLNEKLVCLDGTVFSSEELKQLPEFGRVYRNKAGVKVDMWKAHIAKNKNN